jgi:hypothetical protein
MRDSAEAGSVADPVSSLSSANTFSAAFLAAAWSVRRSGSPEMLALGAQPDDLPLILTLFSDMPLGSAHATKRYQTNKNEGTTARVNPTEWPRF